MVLLEPLLEVGDGLVHLSGRNVRLGGTAPHNHQPVTSTLGLEAPDVFANFLDELRLVLGAFDIGAIQALDVLGEEHARHRLDRFELLSDRSEVTTFEHIGVFGGVVGIVGKDVPTTELQLR